VCSLALQVTRPLLPLMLADEVTFLAYRAHLVSTQAADNQALLNDAFDKLTADVEKSLEVRAAPFISFLVFFKKA
jgi:hypothetical protein